MKLISDALGFTLTVLIEFQDFETLGAHKTYYNLDTGLVSPETAHTIQIKKGLSPEVFAMVAAHEVYHLFHSIKYLITVDEETEAETFGDLVKQIHLSYT